MDQDDAKKMFILDTNVLLYDYRAIYSFAEHDVVLPIVVLEELDRFKKGNDAINFQAREFTRELDRLAGDQLFGQGLSLGKGRGRLFVEIGDHRSNLVDLAFAGDKVDHRILTLADQMRRLRSDRKVILVSKDINLRMKAKALGIQAEDYETGKVQNVDELYTGLSVIEGISKDIISMFYQDPYSVSLDKIGFDIQPAAHQYYILKNASSSALVHFDPFREELQRVVKRGAYGIEPRNAEQTFALHALLDDQVKLATLTGKAGTGKTLLALASALEQRKIFRQIYLARPIVPLGNRDIGYLPGDIQSKLDPYMQPLWDNLAVIRHRFPNDSPNHVRISEMLEQEKLFIAPLAFIRGRSLDRIFFIVDEAQNLTPHEVKTIITRAGEGTKMVFCGDIYQIDTPYLDSQSNGLTNLVDRMKGQELFAHVNLVKGERSILAELASNLL
ncbi:MAG: PhoH family protein [Deltaproteobacteria bacterium]|nr:PhoH family protein [Deltaproteobacteria bacterium]